MYKDINRRLQGASLSVTHGDEPESHSHIEPFAMAGSVQNLGFLLFFLLRQLPGLVSTFTRPCWGRGRGGRGGGEGGTKKRKGGDKMQSEELNSGNILSPLYKGVTTEETGEEKKKKRRTKQKQKAERRKELFFP